ncbi:MAG: DUF4388 domain-containing protein [Nitrospirota bacterium]
MASIKGDLAVMQLSDLLQWIDLANKTGTITANNRGIEKKIYVQEGKIVYVSSNKEGERLGEYIVKGSHLAADKIKSALMQSQTMKVPFTQRLIDSQYMTIERLTEIIITYAKELLLDAVTWKEGWFEFIQDIVPPYVMNGPIRLNAPEILFKVYRQLEDIRMGFRSGS